jgi:hypothetical protein
MARRGHFVTALGEELAAQLRRYDDEALAALGNRGLLRRARKDLEKLAAKLVENGPEVVTIEVGEQRIAFDARGPARARCSCGSGTICHHVLAAAIRLPDLLQSPPGISADALTAVAALQRTLIDMPAAQLQKHAGKAGYRWAWQFVQDLESDQTLEIGGDRHLTLAFRSPRILFRYMGGGLEGLIADQTPSHIEKYRVAAVLALQRAHGRELESLEPAANPQSKSLAFGKDHAGLEPSGEPLHAARRRLLESAQSLLAETVELGLAHLSKGMEERYATLAVGAQGLEFYRLALNLRRIADHVTLLLERAGGADELRLFDELTVANGLVHALESMGGAPAPARLAGRSRSSYENSGTVELLGLGAYAWRASSGYIGLTTVYWSPSEQSFLTCSDARPAQQRGFDPLSRYAAAGPWAGLGSPSHATGRRVIVQDALLNAAGRISGSPGTSATVRPLAGGETLASRLPACDSWAQLVNEASAARRSLLDEPRANEDWRALCPARFAPAKFDAARQTLVWPLLDAVGQRLDAELDFNEYTRHAIARIEELRERGIPSGTLLIAHLRRTPSGLIAEPVSLIRPKTQGSDQAVDALYFEPGASPGFVSQWVEKIARLAAAADAPAAQARVPSAPVVPAFLRNLRAWLQRHAERGAVAAAPASLETEFREWGKQSVAAGLLAFGSLERAKIRTGQLLLRTNFVYLQYVRLLGGSSEEAE